MSQFTLPITSHIAKAVVNKITPWKMSDSVFQRMKLKPFNANSLFRKCLLLRSDPDTDFVEKYLNARKPTDLEVRRIYRIDNPDSTQAFEGALSLIETESKKKDFQPIQHQDKEANRRREAIERWKRMGDLFGPFRIKDAEISQVKAFPLWHGSNLEKCFSIASSGFAFFGKHILESDQAKEGIGSNKSTDRGYYGSGVYLTNSADYASIYSKYASGQNSRFHLILAWALMREPYPVVSKDEMTRLEGMGAIDSYSAHYIPVNQEGSGALNWFPAEDVKEANCDEFVIFEKAHTLPCFWVELAKRGSDLHYTPSEIMAFAEEGDLNRVQAWIEEDRSRLQVRTEEGETLAYAALSGDQLPLVDWLHTQDPSLIHQTRNDGRSLPFLAVLGGRKEILNFLLDEGISYSSSRFKEEARKFKYEENQIAKALESVDWSIWKIPRKTPHFSGREDLLSEMEKRFSSDPSQSFVKLPLVGLGGVGKSALAAAYVRKFQSRYSLIWWIDAEKSPRAGLKDLGIELGLVKTDTPEEEALKAVISYLNKSPGWLLIFDNAESPISLQSFLPPFGKGHILITSRDSCWVDGLVVPCFSTRESLSLLNKRTGYPSNEDGEKLAGELGHLPLALTQAGAYMFETRTSYKSYLDLYLQERKELASFQSLPEDYPYNVATTWKISLDKLKKTSPESLPILYRALYLASDNIPKSILHEEGLSTLKLNNALKALRGYSLLTTGEESETFSIHRLVQTTIRDYLSPEEAATAKKTLQETFEKEWKFNSDAPSTWVKAKTLLPHLEVFSNVGADEKTARLFLHDLGIYLFLVDANLTRSIDTLNKSLRISKKVYGEEHPTVAADLHGLGSAYHAQGKLSEAIGFYEGSLRIRRKVYGEEHPTVAADLHGLGSAYHAQGKLSEAIGFYEKSLRIRRKVYGEEHPTVAADLNDLGRAYLAQGKLSEAIGFYEGSLRISKKVYGEEHPNVATDLHGLGSAYHAQGKLSEAIGFYEGSLRISKKVYGEEHPNVAADLNGLGSAYHAQGKLSEAIGFYEGSLRIRRKVYGEEHPNVAADLNGLGSAYYAQGKLSEAIGFYEGSLRISKKVYGEEHPNVVADLHGLGSAYHAQGKLSEAIGFYKESLRISKKIYGEEHPNVADNLNNLGSAYEAQGDLSKAIGFHEESLRIRKKIYGEEHPDVAASLNNLRSAYKAQGGSL